MLSEKEKLDLIQEVKRLLERNNIDPKSLLEDTGAVRACPGCIACTCIMCI